MAIGAADNATMALRVVSGMPFGTHTSIADPGQTGTQLPWRTCLNRSTTRRRISELQPQRCHGNVRPKNLVEVQDHGLGILQLQKLCDAGERIDPPQCRVIVVVTWVVVVSFVRLHPFDPEG